MSSPTSSPATTSSKSQSYKLAWATDIHLDMVDVDKLPALGKKWAKETKADALVLTGDLATYQTLSRLIPLSEGFRKPMYMVLGNHDFYGSSFSDTFDALALLGGTHPLIRPLRFTPFVQLTKDTCLVGQEGFYDARVGQRDKSALDMSDFYLIRDLSDPLLRVATMRWFADKEARRAQMKLQAAAEVYPKIVFATHVPPYWEAAWHEGKQSDATWAPYFVSFVMGEALDAVAAQYPKTEITVLCGHTHSSGEYRRSDNLLVRTGAAVYRSPRIASVLAI